MPLFNLCSFTRPSRPSTPPPTADSPATSTPRLLRLRRALPRVITRFTSSRSTASAPDTTRTATPASARDPSDSPASSQPGSPALSRAADNEAEEWSPAASDRASSEAGSIPPAAPPLAPAPLDGSLDEDSEAHFDVRGWRTYGALTKHVAPGSPSTEDPPQQLGTGWFPPRVADSDADSESECESTDSGSFSLESARIVVCYRPEERPRLVTTPPRFVRAVSIELQPELMACQRNEGEPRSSSQSSLSGWLSERSLPASVPESPITIVASTDEDGVLLFELIPHDSESIDYMADRLLEELREKEILEAASSGAEAEDGEVNLGPHEGIAMIPQRSRSVCSSSSVIGIIKVLSSITRRRSC